MKVTKLSFYLEITQV